MPASTLHESAQQEALDAYISMCKSTTQDARVQEDARVGHVTRASKKMPASPRHTHVERYVRRPPCARPSDARVGHVITALAFPRVRQRWPRLHDACKDACVACYSKRQRWPRPGRLQGSRLGPAASIFQATFSPRSGAT